MNELESFPKPMDNVDSVRIGHCRYDKQIYLQAHGSCSDGQIGTLVEVPERWIGFRVLYICERCQQEVLSKAFGVCT